MEVTRLRLIMIAIAVAMIGSTALLVAVTADRSRPTGTSVTQETELTPSTTPTPVSEATPTVTPAVTPSPTASLLLPDVRSLPATDLSIETTPEGRRLRFSATLANDGPGPAELVPDDSHSCATGQRHALQRIYVDADGSGVFDRTVDAATSTRPAGCMVDHADHDHWHFDAMARYALTPVRGTAPTTENAKVSFCLRDNVPLPRAATGAQHYGDCETRLAVQGISPGWADVYTADLADQQLELPAAFADGTYCLHTEADPYRLLLEVDSTDNAAVVTVVITGTSVAVAPTNQCEPLPPLPARA